MLIQHLWREKPIEDWATPTLKEAPWWRKGMTPEEYEVKRDYYGEHFGDLVVEGKYIPLWKQSEVKKADIKSARI